MEHTAISEPPGFAELSKAEQVEYLQALWDRIADGPLKYQHLRAGIRRALLKRFPYAVYFAIEADVVVVAAVLHASRDPAEWQRRGG